MMAFVGFDVVRLRKLADDLQADGRALHRMSADLGRLLADAGAALRRPAALGDTLPSGAVATGAVPPQLDEMAASTRRRCTHLLACESLNRVGFDVDVTVAFDDAAPPDRAKIEAAAGAVLDLQGLDAWFDGDQDDLRAVAALLKGLTPAEADAFVAAIPADALESLNDRARIPDFPKEYMPWVHNGVPWMELVDLTSDLLSKVARPHWRKLQDAFPGIQPPADKIVTARAPGGTVPEYGEAGNSIFQDADGDGRPDLSGSEVRQGRLGDCAFVAALAAVASADPGFVQGGIRQNLNGTVSVRIYASGQEHWVTVTPDLPLTPGRRFVSAVGLNYARTSDGRGNDEGPLVLWPAYYEKAFAVAFTEAKAGAPADRVNDPGYTEDDHSYRAIEAELAARDAPYLTGNEISLSNNLPALRTAFESGHPVVVQTLDTVPDMPPAVKTDYITTHAYYVKGFDPDGRVVLGNPWGGPARDLHVTAEDYSKGFTNPVGLQVKR